MSNDLIIGSVWFGINLLLVRGIWQLCRCLFPRDGFLPSFLHVIITYWLCVIGIVTPLGAFGLLTGRNILLSSLVLVFLLSLNIFRLYLSRWCVGQVTIIPHSSFLNFTVSEGGSAAKDRFDVCWSAFWAIVLTFWLGLVVVGGLLELPSDWDTLMYHLPIVDHFLQTQTICSRDCAVWYNPSGNELMGVWLAAPFSADFLVVLTNLLTGMGFVLGMLELGRQLGLMSPLLHLTCLAAISNIAFLRQMQDTCNDVPVASFVIAGFAYGLRYARTNHKPDLSFASICLGLAVGMKYYALGYVCLTTLSILLAIFLLSGGIAAGRIMGVCLVGEVLVGGFWYARNTILTGLPLYPMGLPSADNPITDHYPRIWESTLIGCGQPEVLPLLNNALWKYGGPCHCLAFTLLPASFLLLTMTGIVKCLRGSPIEGTFRLTFCFALIAFGIVLGITPFAADTLPGSLNMLREGYSPIRFGLSFYTLMLLSLALLLQEFYLLIAWSGPEAKKRVLVKLPFTWLRRNWTGIFTAVLWPLLNINFAALTLYQAIKVFQRESVDKLVDSALLGSCFLLGGWLIRLAFHISPTRQHLLWGILLMVSVVGGGLFSDYLGKRWHGSFADHFDHVLQTNTFKELTNPKYERERICALSYQYFPFFGNARQFRVSQPKWLPHQSDFVNYLKKHDITLIAVLNLDPFDNGYYRRHIEWARQHPEIFSLLHKDSIYSLFSVNRAELNSFHPSN